MTATKTYDITYPNAIAGVVIGAEMKSLEQLVADAGGTMETIQIVCPTRMEYGYVPVARD